MDQGSKGAFALAGLRSSINITDMEQVNCTTLHQKQPVHDFIFTSTFDPSVNASNFIDSE